MSDPFSNPASSPPQEQSSPVSYPDLSEQQGQQGTPTKRRRLTHSGGVSTLPMHGDSSSAAATATPQAGHQALSQGAPHSSSQPTAPDRYDSDTLHKFFSRPKETSGEPSCTPMGVSNMNQSYQTQQIKFGHRPLMPQSISPPGDAPRTNADALFAGSGHHRPLTDAEAREHLAESASMSGDPFCAVANAPGGLTAGLQGPLPQPASAQGLHIQRWVCKPKNCTIYARWFLVENRALDIGENLISRPEHVAFAKMRMMMVEDYNAGICAIPLHEYLKRPSTLVCEADEYDKMKLEVLGLNHLPWASLPRPEPVLHRILVSWANETITLVAGKAWDYKDYLESTEGGKSTRIIGQIIGLCKHQFPAEDIVIAEHLINILTQSVNAIEEASKGWTAAQKRKGRKKDGK